MIRQLTHRLGHECTPRVIWKFARLFCWPSMLAVERLAARRRRGEIFPAFLFISLTTRCQLACRGCWTPHPGAPRDLPLVVFHRLVDEAKSCGIRFFGILGGEPLLYTPRDDTASGKGRPLWRALAQHPDCYFQVFTNGFSLNDEDAASMAALGNVTPLVQSSPLKTTNFRE